MASTLEEIQFVYLSDIEKQNRMVINKFGLEPFLRDSESLHIFELFGKVGGDGTTVPKHDKQK